MRLNLFKKGFTLVEVLVGVTIFLIVALGIAAVLRDYLVSERTNEGRAYIDRVAQILGDRLTDQSYCTARFAGQPLGVGPDNAFSMDFSDIGLGPIPSPLNEPMKNFNLSISKIYFVNPVVQSTPAGNTFVDDAGASWRVVRTSLALDAYVPNEKGKATVGLRLNERVLGSFLLVTTLDQRTIHECMNETRYREESCAAVGKIYNPLGNYGAPSFSHELPDARGCVSKEAFSGKAYRGESRRGPPGEIGPPGLSIPGAPGPPGPPGN